MHITSVILSFVSLHLVFTGCTGKTIASDGFAPDRDNGAAMVELLQLLTSDTGEDAQTPDVGIHSDQEAVSMAMSDTVLKEIISAITQDLDLDLQTLLKDCSNGSCQFCTDTQWFLKFCVKASIIEFGFEVIVSVNGITIFSREISIKNPPPFCVNKIPGLA
ncbi:uncharacterized protein LOC127853004 [Dreissena polymorpha]|uniref:Uncharacterized protein n=1 Tax=Dreissena polymorpha TaxID=45954 RepID=A0A9D4HR66_DREPO|nr:uncharacterized protein LOC127853004 [Dreissena polymorpha]XP_052243088.1 uncharacterized protein LOC127853004 [Dreissena polymorpha]KAH3728021.1 hypothetical protein DPMN_053967 [Dreissena polymorpha]